MTPSWDNKRFLWEKHTGKVFPTQKIIYKYFYCIIINIWEWKINAMVYLPNGKVPAWLKGKTNFLISDKILQLAKKCEIKLNNTQNPCSFAIFALIVYSSK